MSIFAMLTLRVASATVVRLFIDLSNVHVVTHGLSYARRTAQISKPGLAIN